MILTSFPAIYAVVPINVSVPPSRIPVFFLHCSTLSGKLRTVILALGYRKANCLRFEDVKGIISCTLNDLPGKETAGVEDTYKWLLP